MSTIDKRFRRNFVVACLVHAALIGGIIFFEGAIRRAQSNAPAAVELITPADILGDLPTGTGTGRGQYTAPPPEPAHEAAGAPGVAEPVTATEPPVAPKSKAAAPESSEPDGILIPRKPAVKESRKPADAATNKPTADKAAQKSLTTRKSPVTAKSSTSSGSSSTSESTTSIRQRFASALASAEGGSAGGDNRPAGGGNGQSKYGRLGSPEGAADGMAGGVGKGSPFWSYYLRVHDLMYEAWEQPGKAVEFDKKLVTTILLRVARDGRIDAVRLEHSSGNPLMDNSALTAAHSVPRLDPLPEGLGGEFAEISVNFRLEG